MKMSLAWPEAGAGVSDGPAATKAATRAMSSVRSFMSLSFVLVRERPQAQLLLADRPQPRQSMRLHDEKEDDQPSEYHQLDVLLQCHVEVQPDHVRCIGEKDGHEDDEGGAEDRAQDATQAADDHHEEDQERQRDVEGQRLRAAEVEE